jgi:hypothetical protein
MPIAARAWNVRPLIVVAQGAAALAVNMGIGRFVYAPVPGLDPHGRSYFARIMEGLGRQQLAAQRDPDATSRTRVDGSRVLLPDRKLPEGIYGSDAVGSGSSSARRSSRRELTPTLANTLLRCHSTVRKLMNSWTPISGLVCPSRTSRAISAS